VRGGVGVWGSGWASSGGSVRSTGGLVGWSGGYPPGAGFWGALSSWAFARARFWGGWSGVVGPGAGNWVGRLGGGTVRRGGRGFRGVLVGGGWGGSGAGRVGSRASRSGGVASWW